ncbi:hypothetical protein ACLOJK_040813 [Asimina triloba]
MVCKSKSSSADNRTYEDLQLLTIWRREEQSDVVVINLPGFEKQHLQILLGCTGTMKISGERPEGNKWQRFRVYLQVHQDCDLNAIKAQLENRILTVTMPKTNTSIIALTPARTSTPPSASAASSKPTDGAANAKEIAPATPPSAAASPLVCQTVFKEPDRTRWSNSESVFGCSTTVEPPVSAYCFFDRHGKAAMGTTLAAAALTAAIYVTYKFGRFQAHNGE